MATEFFNEDMRLFIDHRVDWARYFRLLRGAVQRAGALECRQGLVELVLLELQVAASERDDAGVAGLAGRFGQILPPSFTCSITFEQSYGGVEGDSASPVVLVSNEISLGGIMRRKVTAGSHG